MLSVSNLSVYEESIKKLYSFESFETIPDNIKQEILKDIADLTIANIEGQDFTNYLSGLKPEDVKPFYSIIESITVGKKSDQQSNPQSFENIVSVLGVIGLWYDILEEFKSSDIINERLKGKTQKIDLNFNIFNVEGRISERLAQFVDNLNDIGVGVKISKNKLNYIEEFKHVQNLRILLREELVLEEVQQAANNILNALDALYKNLFKSNFVGIILPNGRVMFSSIRAKDKYSKLLDEKRTYISGFADAWYTMTGITKLSVKIESQGFEQKKEIFDEHGNLYPYEMFPAMHRQNLMNTKNDFMQVKVKLKDSIIDYLMRAKKEGIDYADSVSEIERACLSALFLLDINGHTIQLRSSLITDMDTFENEAKGKLYSNITGAEDLKILRNRVNNSINHINNITIIYSMSKFEQEVLFAHKLYTGPNATVPSISKPILGLKLDGTLFKENLFGDKFTTILAGSRSGKGTLTQSLLAPLIASGQSIIYLDNKPDIASLFWDLEKKYAEHGKDVHFLAIDSLAQSSTFIKGELSACSRGIVKDENGNIINVKNVPVGCGVDTSLLSILHTYKVLQLLFIAGEIAANSKCNLPKLTNYVFIDEITNLSQRINDLYSVIHGVKPVTKKSSEEEINRFNWFANVCSVIRNVKDGFGTMKTMISDKHNFKFVLIGQVFNEIEGKKWRGTQNEVNNSSDKLKVGLYTEHFIYQSMSMCKKWLSGRLQVSKGDYVLKSPSEYDLSKKTGVFLYHTGIPNGPANLIGEQAPITDGVLFRSYFALVRNDVDKYYPQIEQSMQNGSIVEYFNDNADVGYTNKFLANRLEFYGHDDLENSLNELYNVNNETIVRGVGFDGLLEDIADIQGLNLYSDELVEKLNAPYDRLVWVLKTAGIMDEFGYTCLEDYLYDCATDSFMDASIIKDRFWKGFNNNGIYVPDAKVASKINYDDIEDEELKAEMKSIDEQAHQQMGQTVSEDTDLTPEEKEAEKRRILEQAEDDKVRLLKENLWSSFMTSFNAKKGPIGEKITTLLKKLYSSSVSEDVFNATKESALERKNEFILTLSELTEVLKEYDDLYSEGNSRIQDFVNGKYAPIENLTYNQVLESKQNKGKSKNTEQSGTRGTGNFVESMDTDRIDEGDNASRIQEKSPIMETPRSSMQRVSKNILNSQRLTSQIDTGNLRYNPQNVDSMGNVKASKQLTDQVIKDIIIQFGGANNIDSIAITASGCLVLNDYAYCPQFPDIFMDSLGMAIRNDLENGKLHRVVNLGYVVFTIMNQCVELTIESPKIANSTVFKNELHVKRSYGDLFKRNPNLQVIRLPNEELTRNNPNEQDNTGGLGSKLAGLFGFGRQNNKSDDYVPNPTASSNDNGFVDRMFESKPVRVLTGALGWTLGCKAVVLAATFFGPWGLLFGAFAAAGAYKEIKNDRNRYNSSSTGGSRSSRKNGNGGRGSGVNSGRSRNNGGNGSRKNSQYDDEDF